MTDERKFKITVKVPKGDDAKDTEDKSFTIGLDPKLFDDKKDINHDHTEGDKKYTIKGKAEKGWFGDSIGELKVELDGKELKDPKHTAEQWRYKGPIVIGLSLLVIVLLFVWWWMSSSKESKEEEGL